MNAAESEDRFDPYAAMAGIEKEMSLFSHLDLSTPDGLDVFTEHEELMSTAATPDVGRYLAAASPKRLSMLFQRIRANEGTAASLAPLEGAARAVRQRHWMLGPDERSLVVDGKEVLSCRMYHHAKFFAAIEPAVIISIIVALRG